MEEHGDNIPVPQTAAGGAGGEPDAGFTPGFYAPMPDPGPVAPFEAYDDESSTPQLRAIAKRDRMHSILAAFLSLWTIELLRDVVSATNTESRFSHEPVTLSDIIKWIAITIMMGYNRQPPIAHYWSHMLRGDLASHLSSSSSQFFALCRFGQQSDSSNHAKGPFCLDQSGDSLCGERRQCASPKSSKGTSTV